MAETETETEFKCALSGIVAKEADLVDDAEDDDDLGECPIGWLRMTVERRGVNPAWSEFQTRKARILGVSLTQTMAQLPAEMSEADKAEIAKDIEFQINATLQHAESQVDKYITIEAVIYIQNPEVNPQVAAAWQALEKDLGLTFEEAE